tara:strand:- start:3363 stop:4028 length:666 start_codon:yes stop_codon:yes gene_type:complete
MTARLISYSQPANIVGIENVQDLVAYCARVSNPSNQINNSTSEKLIRYLIKHGHWSPLEMASACVEIETTRDIAHQIVRHRSFAFQEFSQRYAKPEDMGNSFIVREARLQDSKNRQNSIELDQDSELHYEWEREQKRVKWMAEGVYQWAIKNGIAKEQARAVLPEGNTKTKLYMQGSLRSWVHYVDLRSGHGTQKEHMQIARECARELKPIFPMIMEFVND